MKIQKRHGKTILEIDVRPEFARSVDPEMIRRLIERVLVNEGVQEDVEISLFIAGDADIRELNARHRGIDQPTDVLSFPLAGGPGEIELEFVLPPGHARSLGDVVVSYERALEQAREYGHSVEREIGYLVVHGVLHLLGYDHETEPERQLMRAREEAALVDLPRSG